MERNNWIKTLNNDISYLTCESLDWDVRDKWDVNRHSNITFELHIILQGSCQLEVESTHFGLEAGQAIIIRPGVFHSSLGTSSPILRFTLAFWIQAHSLLNNAFPADEPFILFEVNSAIRRICHEILKEHDTPAPLFHEEMISALLSQLWILISRSILPQNSSSSTAVITTFSNIRTIELFFAECTKSQKSRKDLANLMHCSERQVNRILLQLYGMSFRQKKQQARMDYAKFLLRNTDKKIFEICFLVGYTDETAFYKAFKANCKMTPQEFRRRFKTSSEPSGL